MMIFPARIAVAAASFALLTGTANAAPIVADTVLDFYNSGTGAGAEGGDPTGGGGGYAMNGVVPFSHVTDGDSNTYISLPKGSYVTLGFSTGYIFDAPNQADLFIGEIGSGSEDAEVYVSDDFGATFTYLANAYDNTTTNLDFADYNYTGQVNAVKVVGLDNGGSAPGFDLTFVEGLEGSVVEEPQGPEPGVVPLPATLPMLLGALGLIGAARRRG